MTRRAALVTGGGQGIGRGIVERFADDGYAVVVADLSEEHATATAQAVTAAGGAAIGVACDVRSASDMEQAVARACSTYGGLDVAVNNAGLGTPVADVADVREEDWNLVIGVNLTGIWQSMKAEIPALLERGGGAIVNMSSMWGIVGNPDVSPAYVASKHGVVGLTKAAALQYATREIRVNAICPGGIDTPGLAARIERLGPAEREIQENFHPIKRLGQPRDVAEAALWLASPAASFVTGTTLSVDGGFTAA